MLVGPKDGHGWQSEGGAPATASRSEALWQGAIYGCVRDKAAGKLFYCLAQEPSAGRAGSPGNSDRQAYNTPLGCSFFDEARGARSISPVA
jgi:hypothetical protein